MEKKILFFKALAFTLVALMLNSCNGSGGKSIKSSQLDPKETIEIFFNDYLANGKVNEAVSMLNMRDFDGDDVSEYIENKGKSLMEKYFVEVMNVTLSPERDRAYVLILFL